MCKNSMCKFCVSWTIFAHRVFTCFPNEFSTFSCFSENLCHSVGVAATLGLAASGGVAARPAAHRDAELLARMHSVQTGRGAL